MPKLLLHLFLLLGSTCFAENVFNRNSSFPDSYQEWLDDSNYQHVVYLGAEDHVAVHWTIEDTILNIAVAVKNATGWVGFGIAETGGMPGSDIALYEVATDELTDTYATSYSAPTVDCVQNWNLVNSVVDEVDELIIFEATRLLDTNDGQDREIYDDSSEFMSAHRVVAAWGDESSSTYHGEKRASGAIRFFQSADENRKKALSSYSSVNVTAMEYEIPAEDTIYEYFDVNISSLEGQGFPQDKNVHVVGFGFLKYLETYEYIHHIVLYAEARRGDAGSFFRDMIYGWAPGSLDLVLPDNVGFLFGPDGYDTLILNIHYDNRNFDKGQIDSTGVILYYTEDLREHDAGVFQIGDGFLWLSDESVTQGSLKNDEYSAWEFTCPCDCIRNALDGDVDEVTFFAEGLHMHEVGSRMETQHLRNGELIRTISVDHFDFGAGGLYMAPIEPYKVRPGDSFKTTCYYKTDENRVFGTGSQDEMCIDFVWYYPKVLPSFCGVRGFNDGCTAFAKRATMTDSCLGRSFGVCPDDKKDRDLELAQSCPKPRLYLSIRQIQLAILWQYYTIVYTYQLRNTIFSKFLMKG